MQRLSCSAASFNLRIKRSRRCHFSDVFRRILDIPHSAGVAGARPTRLNPASASHAFNIRRPTDPHAQGKIVRKAIIVEGLADRKAVQRALSAAVFVLGSSTWVEGKNAQAVLTNLREGLSKFDRVVVLLDPDFAGRKGRNILEASFPGQFWHAFVPATSATSLIDTRWHEAGNVGVEHASPGAIREALANSRQADPQRSYFTRDMLMKLGLTASHTETSAGGVRQRRDRVCEYLGIGSCDGKQLQKQLNMFNFTEDDVKDAIAASKPQQQ